MPHRRPLATPPWAALPGFRADLSGRGWKNTPKKAVERCPAGVNFTAPPAPFFFFLCKKRCFWGDCSCALCHPPVLGLSRWVRGLSMLWGGEQPSWRQNQAKSGGFGSDRGDSLSEAKPSGGEFLCKPRPVPTPGRIRPWAVLVAPSRSASITIPRHHHGTQTCPFLVFPAPKAKGWGERDSGAGGSCPTSRPAPCCRQRSAQQFL